MFSGYFNFYRVRGGSILGAAVFDLALIAEHNRLESDHVLTCLFQVDIPGPRCPCAWPTMTCRSSFMA